MANGTLDAALQREHREIDAGLEAFAAGLPAGELRTEPLMSAVAALRRHIYLEETMLFPPLQQAGLMAPIFVMLREHGAIWQAMDTLVDRAQSGAGSDALRETYTELAALIEAHNMKEEPVLYSQADAVLAGPASDELNAFIASGQMPDGWVCATARS